MMGEYTKNWNALDTMIYQVECYVKKLSEKCREREVPTVEEIINVETEHHQNEVATLKDYRIPGIVEEKNGLCYCPKCKKDISRYLKDSQLRTSFCPECGKRIIIKKPLPYKATIGEVNNSDM